MSATSRPNVLLLVVDSLRADAVFGDHVSTPTLDAYARAGASFRQCICTCTTTTPSFSSMLTGCFPPKHGVRGLQGYRLKSTLTTLAEAFGAAGYGTYAEVTGPLLPETGILRGFEHARHRPAYKVPFFGWRDDIIGLMDSLVSPWFMLLHIWEVHRPYRSPPDFEKRKDRAGYEAAVSATDEWLEPVLSAAGENALVVITGDHGEEYPESNLEMQAVRVARKVRKGLKLEAWFPVADQRLAGLEIGHGFALHEPLIRVPLILSGPGVNPAVVHDQVRHVDLLPTLLDVTGIDIPAGIDGRSLAPLIAGGTLTEAPAYLEAVGVKLGGDRLTGARTPDFKLIKSSAGRAVLYRLNGRGLGPDERHDQYRRYPEVAHQLEYFIDETARAETDAESGMTSAEEAIVEQHLRDLGYL